MDSKDKRNLEKAAQEQMRDPIIDQKPVHKGAPSPDESASTKDNLIPPTDKPDSKVFVDDTDLVISEAESKQKIYTPGMLIRRRFFRRRIAVVGLTIFALILLAVIFFKITAPADAASKLNRAFRNTPPSANFWLGTDTVGRDMFARLMEGGQVSLMVGVVAVLIQVMIGMLVGGVAGYYGGWIDNLLMRFLEIVQSFPFTPLAITISAMLGSKVSANMKLLVVIGLIGFLSWPGLARMIRGQILSLREMEFVQAAKALGVRDGKIITRHLLPNTIAYIIVNATIGMAGAILTEAGLSFLGLGVPPSTPTWGNLINAGANMYNLQHRPWLWIPPGMAIFLTVMSINLIGDGMRDAIDPKSK